MFAVFKSGGKQYKAAPNDVLKLEKLEGEAGSKVKFTEVLTVADGAKVEIGAPSVANAVIEAEILEQKKDKKIIIFKKRRRQNSRRKNGHRQHVTVVRVLTINGKGAPKPITKKSEEKPIAKAEASAAPETKAEAPKAEKKTTEKKEG